MAKIDPISRGDAVYGASVNQSVFQEPWKDVVRETRRVVVGGPDRDRGCHGGRLFIFE